MVFLAHQDQTYVTSSEIAESSSTNPVVLRRIAASLHASGLVESQKGPGGGIRLAKSPDQITMDQIYRAVETSEPLHLPHTAPNTNCPVGRAMEDVLKSIFVRAETALSNELHKMSLCDVLHMVREYKPSS